MKTKFKKFVCELAGYNENECSRKTCVLCEGIDDHRQCCGESRKITLEILIKACWAINREGKWRMIFEWTNVLTYKPYGGKMDRKEKNFFFVDHNNSELESLKAALRYIFDNRNDK